MAALNGILHTTLPGQTGQTKLPGAGDQKGIERPSHEVDVPESKLIRSFISQCATAYAARKPDAAYPVTPKQLKAPINLGGNLAWLGSQLHYQGLFFYKVWAQPKLKKRE